MNYVKLNNNKDHLSLGNIFNEIKKISINKESAIQSEIFCILFDIDNISDTTVGNYCTGYRAIGSKYKQIYLNYRKHFQTDKSILITTIANLISIMEGTINNISTIGDINDNITIKKLCQNIHTLVKNDLYVPNSLKKELLSLLNSHNYYEYIVNILFFAILEKQQPLYTTDLVTETIDEILTNTNMSINDLKKYLEIEFKEGISFIPSLKKLASSGNPYAQNRLGNLEYNGYITGTPRYHEAYNYYLKAADNNHPTSCFMIAHMLFNKQIGSNSEEDINLMWHYLKKAESLNSISAINTLGLCYLKGINPKGEINRSKAISYFEKAASKNYIYAFNNLGKLYEENNDIDKSFSYYQKSADAFDSWACNKMGLYYYEKKDYQKSFDYFTRGSEAPISTRIDWNIYNLVNLFYLKGNGTLGTSKDIPKCLTLLEEIKDFPPANELFLYCYYELYLNSKEKQYLDKINYYLNIVNNDMSNDIKKNIESNLKNIYEISIKLS